MSDDSSPNERTVLQPSLDGEMDEWAIEEEDEWGIGTE